MQYSKITKAQNSMNERLTSKKVDSKGIKKLISKITKKDIVFILYIIIVSTISYFHEYWRDEVQAWLIARDLSFIDIIKQMQYEGHPALWHLILAPFAKLGFPLCTLSIINLGIMIVTVWLLLYKAKLDENLKILFVFTAPFLYLYPAVARSYSLVCLLVVLISILYEKRKQKSILLGILVCLLTNTHVIIAAFSGMIFLMFYLKEIIVNKNRDKKIIIGAIITFLGFILLFLQIYKSMELCQIRKDSINTNNDGKLENIIIKMIGFFEFVFEPVGYFSPNNLIVSTIILVVTCIIVIILLIKIPNDSKSEYAITSIAFIFIFCVEVFIYCIGSQRDNLFFILLVFYIINYKRK